MPRRNTIGTLSDDLTAELCEYVHTHLGLFFPRDRWRNLTRGVAAVARESKFTGTEDYVKWLLASPVADEQLDAIAVQLTIGETYFFRDSHVFKVIQNNLIPEFIRSRERTERILRFWSAGCSTGEEPYSIAIVMDQMRPMLQDWKISIMASDLNSRFLEKAKKGVYTPWSLRATPDWIKGVYFKKKAKDRYVISQRIRNMVTFQRLNLAGNGYPSLISNTQGMDVVFCRNVLMYFSPHVREQAIDRLARCVNDRGWLIVSPSECAHVNHNRLAPVRFPPAIIYQREPAGSMARPGIRPGTPFVADLDWVPERESEPVPAVDAPASASVTRRSAAGAAVPTASASTVRPPAELNPEVTDPFHEALDLYENGRHEEATGKLMNLLAERQIDMESSSMAPGLMALTAKGLANQGRLEDAMKWCEKAVAADKLHAGLYYLQATISQEQGNPEAAVASLQKALYLDPNFVLALFTLGNQLQKMGKIEESLRHLRRALGLLRDLDPEELLPYSEGVTAGMLVDLVEAIIAREQIA